jgi:hypothetical protein
MECKHGGEDSDVTDVFQVVYLMMLKLIQLQWLLQTGRVPNEIEHINAHSYGGNLFLNLLFTIPYTLLAWMLIYYS